MGDIGRGRREDNLEASKHPYFVLGIVTPLSSVLSRRTNTIVTPVSSVRTAERGIALLPAAKTKTNTRTKIV